MDESLVHGLDVMTQAVVARRLAARKMLCKKVGDLIGKRHQHHRVYTKSFMIKLIWRFFLFRLRCAVQERLHRYGLDKLQI
jgi:hypothetical protein